MCPLTICHEIASAYEIESEEVAKCLESCVAFLRAADEFISETIYPGAPLTQSGMNIAANKSLNEKRDNLAEAVAIIRKNLDSAELIAFDDSQEKWDSYCEAWVNFVVGERSNSGTIWPTIYASEAETAIVRRLEEVKSWRRLGD